MTALRCTLGLFALKVRLMSTFWIDILASGLLLPLGGFVLVTRWQEPAFHLRTLCGVALLSATVVMVRHFATSASYDRLVARRSLFSGTLVRPAHYLGSELLEGLLLSALPLGLLALTWSLHGGLPGPVSTGFLVPYFACALFLTGFAVVVGNAARSLRAGYVLAQTLPPLLFSLSPLLYPTERVPEAIRPLIAALPLTLGVESMAVRWEAAAVGPPAHLLLGLWAGAAVCAGFWVSYRRLDPEAQ